jgi:histidine triad (HIT) family protein
MADPTHNCIFCSIAKGEVPVKRIAEDAATLAFPDINPQAPVHVLVVPKHHYDSLSDVPTTHDGTLGHLLAMARRVAAQLGVEKQGYRLVINTGRDAGQTVAHLHVHLLAGRSLLWPPG